MIGMSTECDQTEIGNRSEWSQNGIEMGIGMG